MLKVLVILASVANVVAGLVLVATWAVMWRRVPIVVLFIGASLIVQGGFTLLYLSGDLDQWRDLATGALFAGEALSAVVGAAGLFQAILHNMKNADLEMAPVLAGVLMLGQAIITLLYLLVTDRLRPRATS